MGDVIDMQTRKVISKDEPVVFLKKKEEPNVLDSLLFIEDGAVIDEALWSKLMDKAYILIPGFPKYEINVKGKVRRSDTESPIAWSVSNGYASVQLQDNEGKYFNRGIKKIVKILFGKDIDTRV